MSETSERIRREWGAGDAKRDEGLVTPEDIVRYDDIAYGEHKVWNLLDVYRPRESHGRLPVIVNVHGGGWVYGDKDLYQFYGMSLAQRGFAVVNFSYRLAPEYKYPSQLEDINKVATWMMENHETYGLDLNHVFFVGDSAGGHLAALYGAFLTNETMRMSYDFNPPKGFKIKAMGLNCGVYAPISSEDAIVDIEDYALMKDFLPKGGTEDEVNLINSTLYVTPDFPPSYIMTAMGDTCKKHAGYMDKALTSQGVYHEYEIYGTEENPLYHVFHVTMQEPEGRRCNDIECAFFRKFIS